MIKIAIIGMGRMGRIHLDNLSRKINGVELTMVVDPKNDGQKFALDNGVNNVSNSVNTIIENPEIDAVVISSPSSTHCEYVIKFAKAGKAIFCEKPIDMSLQKATKAISIISIKPIFKNSIKKSVVLNIATAFDNVTSNLFESIKSIAVAASSNSSMTVPVLGLW